MVDFLKVRIISKPENYELYKEKLEKAGFVISEDASLIFKETDNVQEHILGYHNNQYEMVHISKIIYIESYGHDVFLNTDQKVYKVKEKLYEIESILSNQDFVRINKSTIIAKKEIRKLKPYINGRIHLVMSNKQLLSVSRNYSKRFRNFIGY